MLAKLKPEAVRWFPKSAKSHSYVSIQVIFLGLKGSTMHTATLRAVGGSVTVTLPRQILGWPLTAQYCATKCEPSIGKHAARSSLNL